LTDARWTRFASVAAVVVGLLLTCATARAEADGGVVVGGQDRHLPFETRTEAGEPVGFNVDLMRAIGRTVGFEPRFEIGAWPEKRRQIATGDIDVLAMFVSDARESDVDFAHPHLIVSHRIYVPRGAEPIEDLEDLAGRRVAAQRDAYSHEQLRAMDIPAIDLVPTLDEREALRLLSTGRFDAALLTEYLSRRILAEEDFGAPAVSGGPVLPVEYAFAVTAGNETLLAMIDEGLDQVQADGRFDEIHARWLGSSPAGPPGARSRGAGPAWAWAALGVAALLAVAAGVVAIGRPRRTRQDRVEELRRHDALTGVLNRTAFQEALASRSSSRGALAFVHVDRFRLINDSFGHAQGDVVLRRVAGVLASPLEPDEVIGRVGDDEFAVLLARDATDAVRTWGERIVDTVRDQDFARGSSSCTASVTIGFALDDPAFDDADGRDLMRRADAAAQIAKEEGGDRVRAWSEGDARIAERQGELRWIRELPTALDEDRLVPFWQAIEPTVAHPGRLPSVELLARLRTRDGKIVAAGRFVGAAERYGLADRVDLRMLKKALAWLIERPGLAGRVQRVHLNVSGRSLGDPRFLAEAEDTLARYAALHGKLCIEVTETALISNLDTARESLARIRTLGIRIALDDFGVGQSSMSYLKALPVDVLKIDGSFVRDLGRDHEAATMIRSIDRMAHEVGLSTVAEFVESEEVRAVLAGIGVDAVQGYGVGPPRPLSELAGWLDARERRAPNPTSTGPRTRASEDR
jgi:diguanylate cyclase (GGDEF)-like protein